MALFLHREQLDKTAVAKYLGIRLELATVLSSAHMHSVIHACTYMYMVYYWVVDKRPCNMTIDQWRVK